MPRGRPRKHEARSGGTDGLIAVECDPLFFERAARASGYCRIAGLDEAGRGPLAGPVVAAAVVLPQDLRIHGVTDSKLVAEKERERLFNHITKHALAYGIGIVDERTIDDVNIYQATIIAMERALDDVHPPPDYLLIDALALSRVSIPQNPIVKGDLRSHSIAAASILAKVTRDRLMLELHRQFPCYNFHRHKGYGTREHLELLERHGPCEAHRRTFGPVARMLRGAGR